MRHGVLWDNDVLFKCTKLDLWKEIQKLILFQNYDHYYLQSAKYIYKKKVSKEVHESFQSNLKHMKEVSKLKDPLDAEIFSQISGIDPGEAFLFGKMKEDHYLLFTGDKRALKELVLIESSVSYLKGRILLWENFIYELINHLSGDEIQKQYGDKNYEDNFFKVVFSKENLKDKEKVLESIQNYIQDAEKQFGQFLHPNPKSLFGQ
jgi:hypothetical protein